MQVLLIYVRKDTTSHHEYFVIIKTSLRVVHRVNPKTAAAKSAMNPLADEMVLADDLEALALAADALDELELEAELADDPAADAELAGAVLVAAGLEPVAGDAVAETPTPPTAELEGV